MSEKRRSGLGRGLGALIPSSASMNEDTSSEPREESSEETSTPKKKNVKKTASPAQKQNQVAQAKKTSSAQSPQRVSPQKTRDEGALKPQENGDKKGEASLQQSQKKTAPRSKAGRPVDFFFQPGPSGEENIHEEEPQGIDLDRLRGGREKPSTRKKRVSSTSASRFSSSEGNSTKNSEKPVSRETKETEEELRSVPGARFEEIPLSSIRPNSKQPRTNFNEDEMDELVHSLKEIGVLQPIVVREDPESINTYELVMGERRWRASQLAGLETIPAIVRETSNDDLLRDALLENLHRSQLNPLEEGAAYQQLLEEFGCTQEELSERIGRSRPQISNTIRLMKLPPIVQLKVAAGSISAGHARALLSLQDPSSIVDLAQRIINEGLSVRATEEIVSQQDALRTPGSSQRVSRETPRHERLDYLANSLSDRLDTNVKITLGARKGKVQIDFATIDDLNRIMDVLGNQ